jgi:uncharacterized protein (DUF2237 family)
LVQLSTPRIRLILADDAAPDGMTEHVVQAVNADLVAFDRERPRYNWPGADTAPMLWITYIGWKAAMRCGVVPPMKLPEFEAKALQVEALKDGKGEDETVDPTQRAAEPG